jgi:hypothetical protein
MNERTMGLTPPRVMTIAGIDSSGGAGIAADLHTFAACGVHGCFAVTAVTVQNSLGVSGVHPIPAATMAAQIESVVTDIGLDVVKTGMLANVSIIEAISAVCDRFACSSGSTCTTVRPGTNRPGGFMASDRGTCWSRAAATCGRTCTAASTCYTTGTRSANYQARWGARRWISCAIRRLRTWEPQMDRTQSRTVGILIFDDVEVLFAPHTWPATTRG